MKASFTGQQLDSGAASATEDERKVVLRDLQLYQLDILREFIRVCEKHNLRYWLAYGALLGAARHEGFIPWDDDIDLWMPAPDYLRFREVCKESLSPEYYLQVHSENPCNYIKWQRVGKKGSTSLLREHADIHGEWGICIDIFPMCGSAARDSDAYNKKQKLIKRFAKLSKKYVYLHDAKSLTGWRRWYHLMVGGGSDARNIEKWLKLEKQILDVEGLGNSAYCACSMDSLKVMRYEWFDGASYLPYEDMLLPVPKDYKNVLVMLYGENWAEIPPEEKRVCHGGIGNDKVIVSLTEPYTKFLC